MTEVGKGESTYIGSQKAADLVGAIFTHPPFSSYGSMGSKCIPFLLSGNSLGQIETLTLRVSDLNKNSDIGIAKCCHRLSRDAATTVVHLSGAPAVNHR